MTKTISKLSTLSLAEAEQINLLSLQLGYRNDLTTLFKRTTAIISQANECVFVAKIDERIIGWIHGFVALRVETDLFVEIAALVIDEQHHKLGIGRELITAVKDWAITMEVTKIRVRCNIVRTESHKFYQRIGFKENKQQMVFEMEP